MYSVARDFERARDPVQLAIDAGYAMDNWQCELARSDHKRHLLLASRQSGKSTVCALMAVHEAIYSPGSLILLIAPAQRQSSELFLKVKEILLPLAGVPGIAQESALSLRLRNRSRIVALPGTEATIRGFSGAKTIIVDEAARVDDALIAAIRPMLAITDGRLIALTTPYGKRGWFWEAWDHGQGWHRTKITAHECPRISKTFLESERAESGDWIFRQEFLVEFVDTDEQLFSSELIAAAFTDEEPLWND